MENKISKLKLEKDKLKKEFGKKIVTYIGAGLGLVAGLAWNDAIKAFIEENFPLESGSTILAKFAYALIMTLVVVLITFYLARIFKVEEDKNKNKK